MLCPCDPASAELLELEDGGYVEIARSHAGRLAVPHPFPLELDLTVPGPAAGA